MLIVIVRLINHSVLIALRELSVDDVIVVKCVVMELMAHVDHADKDSQRMKTGHVVNAQNIFYIT